MAAGIIMKQIAAMEVAHTSYVVEQQYKLLSAEVKYKAEKF